MGIGPELQLVLVRIEVSDDCGVVPALDLIKVDHEGVGAITTGHRHAAARRHQRVIQIPAGQGILAR